MGAGPLHGEISSESGTFAGSLHGRSLFVALTFVKLFWA